MKKEGALFGNLRLGMGDLRMAEQSYVYTLFPSREIVLGHLRVGGPAGIYIPHL